MNINTQINTQVISKILVSKAKSCANLRFKLLKKIILVDIRYRCFY